MTIFSVVFFYCMENYPIIKTIKMGNVSYNSYVSKINRNKCFFEV